MSAEEVMKQLPVINTYTCAMCGGVFEKGWSDDDALSEKEAIWGDVPLDECEVVCDDCWQRMRPQ